MPKWLKTQYDLLQAFDEWDGTSLVDDVAWSLKRSNNRAFKTWLANLENLGLIQKGAYPNSYAITDSGRRLAEMPYVSLPHLRLMWGMNSLGVPALVEELYVAAQKHIGSPLNQGSKLCDLKRNHYVTASTSYRNKRFRTLYSLTAKGSSLLEAYKPLEKLE